MNTRISLIRKRSGLNQLDFASKIGLTKNFISLLETGDRKPSDRTITDICREFGIREEWLRTGEMPMEKPVSRQAEIAKFVGETMKGANGNDKQRVLTALMDATPEEIEAIVNFARRIAAQYENEKDRP